MTTAEKIKEIIGGIFFAIGFFGLIGATSLIQPIEDNITEMRGE